MATQADVRRIALSLPEVVEVEGRFVFAVPHRGKHKEFAWVWKERVDPKEARVPNVKVLAVRVANEIEKQEMLASDDTKFFTEPHYNGFPAILVRLPKVGARELRELLTDAWRVQAPKSLVKDFDEGRT